MLVDTLTGLRGRRLIDEDGNPEVLELLPPATPLELASLEKEVPCAVVWAPVYYACHDPPVIVYQAASIEEFLLQTVQLWEKGARSPVDIVHEDATSTIWKHNPGVLSQAEAARSPAAYQAPEARA